MEVNKPAQELMQVRPHNMFDGLAESMKKMKEIHPTKEAIRQYFEELHGYKLTDEEVASIQVEHYTNGDHRIGWKDVYLITMASKYDGKRWVIGYCNMAVP